MAQAVTDLAKRRTGDADRAVDVIDQPANVIQDEWEVRVELAFHRSGLRARNWSFDVYLIHYWDEGRMPAV